MKLSDDKRHLFKEPKGRLFQSLDEVLDYLNSIDYKKVITVGDMVSASLLKSGIRPDMVIIDYVLERSGAGDERREIIEDYSVPFARVENPPAHISEALWETIRTAETPLKVIVEGEEDLATLPATLFAPNGSVVIYGQPGEGIVVIDVDEDKKKEFENMLDHFDRKIDSE